MCHVAVLSVSWSCSDLDSVAALSCALPPRPTFQRSEGRDVSGGARRWCGTRLDTAWCAVTILGVFIVKYNVGLDVLVCRLFQGSSAFTGVSDKSLRDEVTLDKTSQPAVSLNNSLVYLL